MKKTILFGLTILVVLSTAVTGETRLVPGEYPNIQAAIDDCNDGDVVIVADGVYTADGQQPGKIYWTDMGSETIKRATIDGSGVETLIAGLSDPRGIALDVTGGKVYYTNKNKIQRANLDGSGIESLVTIGLIHLSSIALDLADGKMYWTDWGTDKIQRANLDGSGVEDLVTTGLIYPSSIALDLGRGRMYWTDSGTDKIQRANLGGSGVQTLVKTGFGSAPKGIALDVASGKMYWTDHNLHMIYCANLDGSGVKDLIFTRDYPDGIALDLTDGKVYWTADSRIRRVNLDGSGREDIITTGLSSPYGIALSIPDIIDFGGKAITVRSENGPQNCIVDCNEAWCGFWFGSRENANSVLDGFTITKANGTGIMCWYSSPMVKNCLITGNGLEDFGGGISCYFSCPTISNCIMSNNNARQGGGIYCESSDPALINCTIEGNKAEDEGGGIYCRHRSKPTLTNCTIAGNTVGGKGGGIYLRDWRSELVLTNCTVAGNIAENNGGGIFCREDSLLRLSNCILWGNSDESGIHLLTQIQGGRPEVIYSCIQDDDPNDMDIPFGDANGNIDDKPRFVREPDDGGDGWGVGDNDDFGDLHLRVVSPCINTGLPNFVAGANTVDMDGQPRIMGRRIDMGADEYEKIIVVTEPEGGEVWAARSTHEIEWSSYGAGEVDIMLSKDAGDSWQSIKKALSDTGGYSWRILNKYCSEEAQVKVVPSEPDANVICIESGVFEIVPYEGPASVPRRKKEPKYKPVEKYGPEFGCVKWKFETEGPVTAGVTIGREINKQRKVYAACEDGKLYALDLETGTLLWSYDVNSALVGSAAEGLQGCVYVGGRDGRLYAIDKEGQLLWTHSTEAPIYSSAVVSPQEQIYVCSEDGMLYALRRNGSEVWRYETSGFAKLAGSIFTTLQIGSDGTVYIAGLYDPNLYALNPKDGSVKWRCNFAPPHDPCAPSSGGRRSGWPFASPAIAPDGTIYQTLLYDPNLYAVEPDTGTVIWSTDLAGTLMWYKKFEPHDPCPYCYYQALFIWYGSGDPPEYIDGHELYLIGRHRHAPSWTSPALGPDGTIYVSFDDPYLRAVDPDGNVKWATRLGMVGGLTVTVGDDGLVYAASYDNKLYVVEPTGEEVARFEGDGWLSHPTIAPGHTIIVSDANNTVWAITQEDCGDKPIVLDVPPDGNEP